MMFELTMVFLRLKMVSILDDGVRVFDGGVVVVSLVFFCVCFVENLVVSVIIVGKCMLSMYVC